MTEQKDFELEFTDETVKMIEDYAKLSGQTEEQVVDYILFEFLERQVKIIEKRAQETGKPVNELLNMQFRRILEALMMQVKK